MAAPSLTSGAPALFTSSTIFPVLCSASWRKATSFVLTDFTSLLLRMSVPSCWLPEVRSLCQVSRAPQTSEAHVSGFVPELESPPPPPPQPAAAKASTAAATRMTTRRMAAILTVSEVVSFGERRDEIGRARELPRERCEGLELADDDVLVPLHALEDAA